MSSSIEFALRGGLNPKTGLFIKATTMKLKWQESAEAMAKKGSAPASAAAQPAPAAHPIKSMTSKLKALAKEQKQLFADLHLSRLQKLVRATDTANNMAKQFTKGKNARDINTAIELATTAAEAEKALKSYLLLLSPAEIPHVQAVFDSMDLNHDSVYSVFEIHTGLTRLGIQVDVNQMAGVFAIAAEKGNFDVDDIDDKGDFRMDAKGFFDIYWAALELELRSLNELADLRAALNFFLRTLRNKDNFFASAINEDERASKASDWLSTGAHKVPYDNDHAQEQVKHGTKLAPLQKLILEADVANKKAAAALSEAVRKPKVVAGAAAAAAQADEAVMSHLLSLSKSALELELRGLIRADGLNERLAELRIFLGFCGRALSTHHEYDKMQALLGIFLRLHKEAFKQAPELLIDLQELRETQRKHTLVHKSLMRMKSAAIASAFDKWRENHLEDKAVQSL
ncbi:hypothetical protein Ctob_002489 [Chrysochromulina tobinii]|uniref:EF-hand domain-containing protein n=1 Tax=Chrysochromulina tobinii TaxID=1460289 RepID=A0A0M0JJ34_9EUKA|nr:hypothetical protein Ctob_002489 [Chrysochromulina tobinii]|eukprot:KOO26601.1 hypothetical protein Ctob_002489 [Chrysochromulina sp. CCMP291]